MSSAAPNASPRIAIVTGASQGLGLAIALRLADDGLDVAVNDIQAKNAEMQDVVSQIQAKGRRAIAVTADVSSEEDVKQMVATVVDKLGGLDVMVANAGITLQKMLVETTVEDWTRIESVDSRGVFLCYKHAALQMIKQGRGGRIIGASSAAGKRGMKTLSAYSAAKFAVRGLTHAAALELAPHNITVNTYAPGLIITQMTLDAVGGSDKDAIARFKKDMGVPDSPHATPEVIASVVSHLARPESFFITGQTHVVDGGVILD